MDNLPDRATVSVGLYSDLSSLSALHQTCAPLAAQVDNSPLLWKTAVARDFPYDFSFVASHPGYTDVLSDWRDIYRHWAAVSHCWGPRLPAGITKPAGTGDVGATDVDDRDKSSTSAGAGKTSAAGRTGCGVLTQHNLSPQRSPVFVVCSLGDGSFATAGADGNIRVVRPTFSLVDDSAKRARTSSDPLASSSDSAPTVRRDMTVLHEISAMDCGMLGGSVDIENQRICVGGFDGKIQVWQLQTTEFNNMGDFPIKRLKSILSDKGIPFDDLREKAELVARIKTFRAFPPARKLKCSALHGHSVVSTAICGNTIISGSNDGTAMAWNLETDSEIWRINHNSGVDCVLFDPRSNYVFTGAKDGTVRLFDVERGGAISDWDCGDCWIWSMKNSTTFLSSTGIHPTYDSSLLDDKDALRFRRTPGTGDSMYYGDGNFVVVGGTDGKINVIDIRDRRPVISFFNAGKEPSIRNHREETLPISGLAAMFEQNRVVSAGFDSYIRVFDTRVWKATGAYRSPTSNDRMARVDVWNDIILSGGMNGGVNMVDMDSNRAELLRAP